MEAKLFHDSARYTAILRATKPWECKDLGKQVTPFDAKTWNAVKYDVVKEGNRAKFEQNPDLKSKLMSTGNAILAEASPKDKIWGIGLDAKTAMKMDMSEWPGQGLQGRALMELRAEFGEETCGPCHAIHSKLDKWLETHDEVSTRYVDIENHCAGVEGTILERITTNERTGILESRLP